MLINLSSILLPILSVISLIISVGLAIGAFRVGFNKASSEEQQTTINMLKLQLELLEKQSEQQQKKLDRQEFELQAMRDALKDEGIYITVDGERITIKDMREPNVTRHVIKHPTHKTTAIVKKEEGN